MPTVAQENLGPAEVIIQSLLSYSDHIYHGRPGIVVADQRTKAGVKWEPVTYKTLEDGTKEVYRLTKEGKRTRRTKIGVLGEDNRVRNGQRVVGTYRRSGLFPEVVVWFYKKIAEVWLMDNEFSAKWGSFAFNQEHRDLKVMLAAFLLVQSRKGEPITEGGEFLFNDEDYRDVGEAMCLIQRKGRDLNPKLLLRIHDILSLPEIAQINRDLGFGQSAKRPFLGRWPKAVEKWLRYREENSQMLEGLVKAGFRTSVMELARRVGYKPTSDRFFEILRWKQKQAPDGRRVMAIGKAVKEAESWEGLSEREVCERIEKTAPSWKRIMGLLPKSVGITQAVVVSALEVGSLSDKDLIILTPTLEALGLLEAPEIKAKLKDALSRAEDMRAANIARNVRSKDLKETLEAGADKVAQKAVEEVTKNLRIYVIVDRSGSMQNAIEQAKPIIAKLLQAIPSDRLHVSVFNTIGKEITFKNHSAKGIAAAFRGIQACGGTSHAQGVSVLSRHTPGEDEDSIMIFIGDEGEQRHFKEAVESSGLRPMAFGVLPVEGRWGRGTAVRNTASRLGIPCFEIDQRTFEGDPYAIPRTLKNLIAATPVDQTGVRKKTPRVSLVDQILKTDLLSKPAWAIL